MKKLLLLILVLGMASTANAAIELTAYGNIAGPYVGVRFGDTVAIGIHSDNTNDYMAYLDFYYVSDGSYKLSNPRFVTGMVGSNSGFVMYYGSYDNDELEITVATAPGETNTAGVQFEIDLQYHSHVADVLVELYDGASPYPLLDTLTIRIPEPMTLAFLALGGLFLTRRRR